jgi:hypothetical protein
VVLRPISDYYRLFCTEIIFYTNGTAYLSAVLEI